eukprot:SAG22_NODE_17747_length_299_cov_0.770000_1_plen_58_part_10
MDKTVSFHVVCLSVFQELPFRWAFTRHTDPETYTTDYAWALVGDRIVDVLLIAELCIS